MRPELRLAAVGLKYTVASAAALAVAALLLTGANAALSVAVAAAIGAANHLAAGLSVGLSRNFDANVAVFAWSSWGMRMAAVAVSFIALSQTSWVHTGWAATAFCLCMFFALAAECRAWVTKSYVPAWRIAR